MIYEKAERNYKQPPPTLIPCVTCGKEVSVNATSCPHCGEPKANHNQQEHPVPELNLKEIFSKNIAGTAVVVLITLAALFFTALEDVKMPSTRKSATIAKIHVSQSEYGDRWPYTIPDGRLGCVSKTVAGTQISYVTLEHAGVVYALNGAAIGSGHYAPLESIWRDNPEHPGSKIPDPGIIQLGLKLCN